MLSTSISCNFIAAKVNHALRQWDSETTGTYIMYQDLWGESSATSGSQCSGIDSLSGSTVTWHTDWTWAGGSSNVKSYAQIYDSGPTSYKQLSAISTYNTAWSWTYSGSNVIADVAYDMFTCGDATSGCSEYEVMVWLAALGGAGPISSTGSPIATPTVAGHTWKLYYGLNGSMKVYSFVATSTISSFSGDLKAFYTYLINSQGFPSTQYLKAAAVSAIAPCCISTTILTIL
jgi:xyloglucan-specific endo-beta-1,4-glucanase